MTDGNRESGIGHPAGISGWTIAKYALAIAGLAMVVSSPTLGRRWLGFVGLALIIIAFVLRFKHRVSRHRD